VPSEICSNCGKKGFSLYLPGKLWECSYCHGKKEESYDPMWYYQTKWCEYCSSYSMSYYGVGEWKCCDCGRTESS
jgi:hypothetical protein